MARKENRKIDTAGKREVGMGLNPFASLEIEGLPQGCSVEEPIAEHQINDKGQKRGRLVLRRETAHRGGKTVVVVSGFDCEMSDAAIDELARDLRKACGSGGCVKEREVELQGEQVPQVRAYLEKLGYRVDGVR